MKDQDRIESSRADDSADAGVELSDEQLEHVVGGLARVWSDDVPPSVGVSTAFDHFVL